MLYRKNPIPVIEAWPWTVNEDMSKVSAVTEPQPGDMIAHDPKNASEKVLISKADFEALWVPYDGDDPTTQNKTPLQREAEQTKLGTSHDKPAETGKVAPASSAPAKPSDSLKGTDTQKTSGER